MVISPFFVPFIDTQFTEFKEGDLEVEVPPFKEVIKVWRY